jgi:glycosyltransferase involved in cell wall biosynthesis
MRPWILVDAFPGLAPAGGIGRYVRDLSHALLTRPDAPPAGFAYPRNLGQLARERYPAAARMELPLAWKPLCVAIAAGMVAGASFDRLYGRPAVMHSTLGYGPRFSRARLIEHVHDLTAIEHPEWHPAHTRAFLATCLPRAVRSAAVVLTHSEHVRRRVQALWGVPAERTVTIPPPLGHDFRPLPAANAAARARDRFGLDGPFVLHVGTLEPRKNHAGLVAAFERLCDAGFPGPLVLVGKPGWRMGPILERIARSPRVSRILRLDSLADGDLVALYGGCTLCAFPSHEEGFGMPLLESMACGAACVTSDDPALAELGGDACVPVSLGDPDALAGAMIALWREPERRAAVAGRGPARAAPYAFDRWVERIFALYRRELAAAGAA